VDAALARLLDGREVDRLRLTEAERALLARLADAAGATSSALDTPAANHEPLAAALDDRLAELDGLTAGDRVGPFRLVRRIGAGGMGVVFLAERVEGGFEQRVALKLLAQPRGDAASIRLFERERELLARLEHPNIARLIDGGLTDERRPWFAMEYIEGEPLIDHADRASLSVSARIELFLQACDALDHAHRRFILHRDIKPANLLVAGDGRVKLVDFGLGRLLEEPAGGAEETLAAGRMTPSWASPEQARGEPVTPRSEVYQLGLVLYRLLTGRAPYSVGGHSAWAIARAIGEARIARPSEQWAGRPDDAAAVFGATAARLRRRLRGDLDNIVLKTLAGSPERRYAGVDGLADDLRRHATHQPVRARSATRRYRLSRFVRRNRAAVAGGGAFIALLLASLVVFGLQSRALELERDRAVASATRSERLVDAMAGMIRLSDADNAVEQLYSLGDLLDRYVAYVTETLESDPAVRARLLGILGRALHGIDRWDRARRVIGDAQAALAELRGPDDPEVLELGALMAEAAAFGGDLAGAVAILDDVAERQARAHGPASEPVADAIFLRGFLRTYHAPRGSADFDAGLADLERALALYRDRFRPPHPDIARTLHALGFKTYSTSRGMQLLNDGLAMTRELFGARHATTATRMAELAFAHDLRGEPARAAEIGARAHRVHVDLRGETHPDSLTMLSNLAGFHRAAGTPERAAALYRELHEIRLRVLPDDHLLLAFTAHGLGNTLRRLGDHAESERWLREALRLCLLHESRNEAVTRENLARTLRSAGRRDEAVAQQRLALAAYRRFYGEDDARTDAARERLRTLSAQPVAGAAVSGDARSPGS
jgi:serine/threonine-protein kinase